MSDKINITDHALVKYLERKQNPKYMQTMFELKYIIEKGTEVKPSDSLRRLLKHGIKETRYFLARGTIAVVRDNLIITVLDAKKETNKWSPVNSYSKTLKQ